MQCISLGDSYTFRNRVDNLFLYFLCKFCDTSQKNHFECAPSSRILKNVEELYHFFKALWMAIFEQMLVIILIKSDVSEIKSIFFACNAFRCIWLGDSYTFRDRVDNLFL